MSFKMNILQFGEFTLNLRTRELCKQDMAVPVSGKAFDLLAYMAENAGRPLSKSELLEAVWPDMIVEESNLSHNVFLLRKVLGTGGDGPIKTLAGRGYQFAAEVTEVAPLAPSNVVREGPAPLVSSITVEATQTRMTVKHDIEERIAWSPKVRLIAMVLLVTALGAAGWWARQRWLDQTDGLPVQAILNPLNGTTGDAILDRSLTDALRIDLSQSPYVSVMSAATVNATLLQMMHKSDDVITPAIAREICERTNSQAVLSGSIAQTGRHYLLTVEASNCVDGRILAEAKQEAASVEDLPHSIDILAGSVRQKLGESRRSISRFNTPLFQDANTSSLDALKAYTQGMEAMRRGEFSQAVTLFKTSVAADSNFATAWYGMAAGYGSAGDETSARTSIAEAYRLKDTASRPTQFLITAAYIQWVTQDLYESLRNDKNWTAIYPNAAQAWNQLSNVQRDLGDYTSAVHSSQKAVALWPHNEAVNVNLVTGLIQKGDLKAARSMLEQMIAEHMDGDGVRIRYLELAFLLHDEDMLQAQREWAKGHLEAATVALGEARIATSEGRFADAHRFAKSSSDLFHQQGLEGAGDRFTRSVAVEMIQSSDEEGRQLLRQTKADPEEGQDLLGLVYSGGIVGAKAALNAERVKYPNGTLWNLYWAPQINAAIAMAEHRPQEAATILEESRSVEMRELVVPWMRGNAYLAAGQPALAEKDFREVVTHPEVDPSSSAISLSWLGLARALAAQNDRDRAINCYQHFLKIWSQADSNAVLLGQGREEVVKLQHDAPGK